MYRRYENPFELQDLLEEKESEYHARLAAGEDMENLIDLAIDIEDLRQRINFAWQDDEYDAEYAD